MLHIPHTFASPFAWAKAFTKRYNQNGIAGATSAGKSLARTYRSIMIANTSYDDV